MEATGGYSRELAFWLLAARTGLRLVIAQPVQVHHFAEMQGQANKTDELDAILLAIRRRTDRFESSRAPRGTESFGPQVGVAALVCVHPVLQG